MLIENLNQIVQRATLEYGTYVHFVKCVAQLHKFRCWLQQGQLGWEMID